MPREDLGLLQKNDKNLFGKKYRENIWHTSKSKKQTFEMLSNTSRKKYKPFTTAFPRHQEDKSFFSGKEQRHSIKKSDTIMKIKTVMDTDIVNINQETLFNKVEFLYVVLVDDLKHIHPYIKSLFCAIKIPNVQLAGRLKNFIENWEILTKDTEILSLVEGYTIPFYEIPSIENIPSSPKLNRKGSSVEGNSRDV